MIKENVKILLEELPAQVALVAAAKTKNAEDILTAIEAGINIIGENYVQEAEKIIPEVKARLYPPKVFPAVPQPKTEETLTLETENAAAQPLIYIKPLPAAVKWHFIGSLQKNKAKKAVELFDLIQTVDSLELAREIDKRCLKQNKTMEILIEINSGAEAQKSGVLPQNAETLIRQAAELPRIKILGLMTMGPLTGDPETSRSYFKTTKILFDIIEALKIPNVKMEYLSMGMTDSYKIAIEEGSNMVRIGTKIFGPRISR